MDIVEYNVTDRNFTTLDNIFTQIFRTRLVLLPGSRAKAFVVVKERNVDNWYMVTLDAIARRITVDQIKNSAIWKTWSMPYSINLYKAYDITFHFGYESSGGAGGNRITIQENVIGMGSINLVGVLDKKLYQIGLDQPADNFTRLFRFFVGTDRSNAIFTGDDVRVIPR